MQSARKVKAQPESQEPAAMTVQFEHNTRWAVAEAWNSAYLESI